MPLLRRFGLLASVMVGAAVLAGPVLAARPAGYSNLVGTTHFLVHFQSDPSVQGAATQSDAGIVAGRAEHAYDMETAAGFAAPPSDAGLGGDNRIDIYILDLGVAGVLGVSVGDNATPQTSGYIMLAGTTPEDAFSAHTISHELFHLVQYGIWAAGGNTDDWLYEGTAEWMGYRATAYDLSGGIELGPTGMSLDCSDPARLNECSLDDPYANGGYSRWNFFEYLDEKYGSAFIKDVFTQAAGSGTAILGLTNAIAAKGTTLTDLYNAWSTAEMTGGYTQSALKQHRPTPKQTVSTGNKAGSVASTTISVNHLSTEYVTFTRGDDDDTHACYESTLSLTVTIPAGTLSKPVFFWDVPGSVPVPLSINGSTATATVPWDTCVWTTEVGYLSLPNASMSVDGAAFGVSATLAIDTSKPASALTPTAPVALPGVVNVSSSDAPPTIDVFGPELLTLASTAQQVRLIVASSGEGSLRAQIGSLVLGTQALRGGNNDLRFTLPKGVLAALRRSASTSNVLTLTPLAANGTVAGPTVSRKISVAPTKQPAKKATKKPVVKKQPHTTKK
jgi:hypothetical protein